MDTTEIPLFVISKNDKNYIVTINDNLTNEEEILRIVTYAYPKKEHLTFEVFVDGNKLQWIDIPKLLPFSIIEIKYTSNSDSKLTFRNKKILEEKIKDCTTDEIGPFVMNKYRLSVHSVTSPCEMSAGGFRNKHRYKNYIPFFTFEEARDDYNATFCAKCFGFRRAGLLGYFRSIQI